MARLTVWARSCDSRHGEEPKLTPTRPDLGSDPVVEPAQPPPPRRKAKGPLPPPKGPRGPPRWKEAELGLFPVGLPWARGKEKTRYGGTEARPPPRPAPRSPGAQRSAGRGALDASPLHSRCRVTFLGLLKHISETRWLRATHNYRLRSQKPGAQNGLHSVHSGHRQALLLLEAPGVGDPLLAFSRV